MHHSTQKSNKSENTAKKNQIRTILSNYLIHTWYYLNYIISNVKAIIYLQYVLMFQCNKAMSCCKTKWVEKKIQKRRAYKTHTFTWIIQQRVLYNWGKFCTIGENKKKDNGHWSNNKELKFPDQNIGLWMHNNGIIKVHTISNILTLVHNHVQCWP